MSNTSLKDLITNLKNKHGLSDKVAFTPPGTQLPMEAPPGGAPMDPAMMGGAPPTGMPMNPAMAGGAPPMDPAMAGGVPPMDPAMAGGVPPMDPAMAGGVPPMPMDPAMIEAAAAQAGIPVEQAMQMLGQQAGGAPMDPATMGGQPPMEGAMPPMDPMGADPVQALNDKIDAVGFMMIKMAEALGINLNQDSSPEGAPDEGNPLAEQLPPDMQQGLAQEGQDQAEEASVLSPAAEEATAEGTTPGPEGFINDQIAGLQQQ